MSTDEENIKKAWLVAAADLGIKVDAPFVLKTGDGREFHFMALIRDFGGPLGTLVCLPDSFEEYKDISEDHGFYCASLYPEGYSEYERDQFIETLNDWGWFGDESKKPSWYTGQSWM